MVACVIHQAYLHAGYYKYFYIAKDYADVICQLYVIVKDLVK